MERKDWIVPTGGREKQSTARLSILVATGLALIKGATALVTGSMGILASAADSVMDVFASSVNFVAIRMADEPEDAQHRYGHGKAEGMAGLFQSLVIGISAVYLVFESVSRMLADEPLHRPVVGVTVMLGSMVATVLLVTRIRRVARESESLALEADSLHYVSDVLANVGVLVGLAMYHFFGVRWADPAVSLVICVLIFRSVVQVFRDSFDNLMDRQLPEEERRIIAATLERTPGVLGFHDLRSRRSGARRFVDIHIEIERDCSFVTAHRVAEEATREIEAGLANTRVLVHADPWPPDPDAYREPPLAGLPPQSEASGAGGSG